VPASGASDWHPQTASPARAIARPRNPPEGEPQLPRQTPTVCHGERTTGRCRK
jgi:hypothetical protein